MNLTHRFPRLTDALLIGTFRFLKVLFFPTFTDGKSLVDVRCPFRRRLLTGLAALFSAIVAIPLVLLVCVVASVVGTAGALWNDFVYLAKDTAYTARAEYTHLTRFAREAW